MLHGYLLHDVSRLYKLQLQDSTCQGCVDLGFGSAGFQAYVYLDIYWLQTVFFFLLWRFFFQNINFFFKIVIFSDSFHHLNNLIAKVVI